MNCGEEDVVGIGHLGAHGEGSGIGVDLGVCEVHETLIGVLRAVGERHGDVGVPLACGVLLPEVDVAGLAAQVVEGGHAEVHAHGVALDDGGQERLPARADERSDVDAALGDVSRDGRLHGGVAQGHFGLREVGLAHRDIGCGAFVRGDGVVEVELARGILFVEGADALQVALGLEGLRLGLVELGLCLVDACAVELRVDDEEGLAFLDIGALREEHSFEVALDPRADLDELLGADASDILAVDADVLDVDRLDGHDGQHFGHGARAEPPPEACGDDQQCDGQGDPAFRGHGDRHAGDLFGEFLFQFVEIQALEVGLHLFQIHSLTNMIGLIL